MCYFFLQGFWDLPRKPNVATCTNKEQRSNYVVVFFECM